MVGDIVDHAAGGEVDDEDGFVVARLVVIIHACFHECHGAEDERVFLADVLAAFVDDGEAVGVGVLCETDIGFEAGDGIAEAALAGEVFFGGFGGVWEDSIATVIELNQLDRTALGRTSDRYYQKKR
ncbi:MAG: hypothetical protein R3B67_03480 [Phycisphaerales bacterium]